MKTSISKFIYYFSGILLIALFWLIISSVKDNFVFPKFSEIFASIGSIICDKNFLFSAFMSLIRVLIVITISLLIAFIMLYIYLLKKEIFLIFKPLIVLMKCAPLAILSVYFWISFGSSQAPYFITLFMTLPVTIEGFFSAADNLDICYINQLKTENVSFIRKFWKIYLPLIKPYIFMTILQTFGLGIKVILMGEYICQTKNSLGQIIYFYKQDLDFAGLLGILLIVMLIVSVSEIFIAKLSKKVYPK